MFRKLFKLKIQGGEVVVYNKKTKEEHYRREATRESIATAYVILGMCREKGSTQVTI